LLGGNAVRFPSAIITIILSTWPVMAQNYEPFLREAEQALVDEFRELSPQGRQDWREWRREQDWRLRQADDEDDSACHRLTGYPSYAECRAKLLALRRECAAEGGDFFDLECD
jgi:hypothetical protein